MVKHAFMVSKNIFHKLFHWLDRDNDTKIQLSDMIFGISRVMLKDSNVKEVNFRILNKLRLKMCLLFMIQRKLE